MRHHTDHYTASYFQVLFGGCRLIVTVRGVPKLGTLAISIQAGVMQLHFAKFQFLNKTSSILCCTLTGNSPGVNTCTSNENNEKSHPTNLTGYLDVNPNSP
jgi:hypothetical protein